MRDAIFALSSAEVREETAIDTDAAVVMLERLGRTDEAREWYETGVEVTRRKGDSHALSEMQGALDLLG